MAKALARFVTRHKTSTVCCTRPSHLNTILLYEVCGRSEAYEEGKEGTYLRFIYMYSQSSEDARLG